MKKALVLYHSLFGNTKKVAASLAAGISEKGIKVDCVSIEEIDIDLIPNYDFLAIGGPTHVIGLSKEMKKFLNRLKTLNLKGKKGFSFDTRNHSRMNSRRWLLIENSASKRIESKLKKMKIKPIIPRVSSIVIGREGPLESGVETAMFETGRKIGRLLAS